jgi:Zn-finger nucleic acid-binding protein
MEMTCPKCRGAMRTYERSGITVDQCTECRGIFLDRGELERLVDAETDFHAPAANVPRPAPTYGSPEERFRDGDPYRGERYRDDVQRDDLRREERHRDDRYRDDDYYRSDHRKKNKKRSFLEDLFD